MVAEVSNDDSGGEGPGGVHGAAGVTDLPGTPRSALTLSTTFFKVPGCHWGDSSPEPLLHPPAFLFQGKGFQEQPSPEATP